VILKIALVALLVGNCTVKVPDVDVFTAPKSKTITAAFVFVVAEVFEL
jgi:hypothetical protein